MAGQLGPFVDAGFWCSVMEMRTITRFTRPAARQQHDMARAIKNARDMALLPYSSRPGQ